MSENKDTYQFTYSASEKKEIEKIRNKYVPEEESKMDQLKRLNASATKKGTKIAIIIGCIGCAFLGIGMYWSLDLLGKYFVPGIIFGLIGFANMLSAYPVFVKITEKEREKIAPEIIRLSDELLKNQ